MKKEVKQEYTIHTRLNVKNTNFKDFFDNFLLEYNKWFREVFNNIRSDE